MKTFTLTGLVRAAVALAIGVLTVIATLTVAGFIFEAIAGVAGVELGRSLGVSGPGSHFAMGLGLLRFGLQALVGVAAVLLLVGYVSADVFSQAQGVVQRLRRRTHN